MDRRIAAIGAFVLVLGIVFIGVSGVSYEKEGGYWYQGDGTSRRDDVSSTIFFENDDRWAVENISYLLWNSETNESVSLPTDGLLISLYSQGGNQVAQVMYGDLKQNATGLPVPNSGLYTIKIEQNIGGSHTISATFVRWTFSSETTNPYNYLFPVGIPLLLGGAGATAYGVVKQPPHARKNKSQIGTTDSTRESRGLEDFSAFSSSNGRPRAQLLRWLLL